MKDLLFIAHRVPYPPNKGDKIRSFNELKYLSEKGWRIHLCALADDSTDLGYAQELRRYCHTVFLEPISPQVQQLRSLLGPLSGQPLSVPYFYNKTVQRRVDAILDSYSVEAVLCFSGPMAEYVFRSRSKRLCERRVGWDRRESSASSPPSRLADKPPSDQTHSVRLIMDIVDVDSDKWTQYATKKRWPMSWVYRLEGRLLSNYEKRVAEAFDETVLVSDAEAEVFRQQTGLADKIHGIANGVDLEFFCPKPPSDQSRAARLVFCGAMDYYPNVDAVVWFAGEVLPLVREAIGEVEFTIVGSKPAEEVRALASIPGVKITGRVDDVRPYIWEAAVSVAPLRVARGIQNKVLEAMAMGKAVVASPQAFEGIEAEPGSDLVVAAAEPEMFAGEIARLLQVLERCEELGRNARMRMESNYSWSSRLSRLKELL